MQGAGGGQGELVWMGCSRSCKLGGFCAVCRLLNQAVAISCWKTWSLRHYSRPIARSYEDSEIALNCGAMFRDCVRHEPVAK